MQIMNDVTHTIAAAVSAAANPPSATTSAGAAGITSATGSTSSSGSSIDSMANEQTFLQLLVAQIQNQDPLSPTDSMQFVTQLAQFSSLEQLIGIHQSMNTLTSDLTSNSTTPTNNTGTPVTNPANGQ